MHSKQVVTLNSNFQIAIIISYMSLLGNCTVNELNINWTYTFLLPFCNAIGTICLNLAGKSSKYSK